jgi:hypothetical protein
MVVTTGTATETVEWSDPRIKVIKGVVTLAVSGNCVQCQAPPTARRLLKAQMHAGTAGGGLVGYAASSVKYAREKKKYGWPEGVKMLHIAAPLCDACRVRFPRWTLVLLGVGVAAAVAAAFVRGLDAPLRLLSIFLPPSIGGAIALAGLVAAEQPVPVRIRKWRERIIVEEPPGTSLQAPPDESGPVA